MATERAIIASDLEQIGQILKDSQTAILVPPSDHVALARGIERLARDSRLRSRLAKAARREVLAKYTWKINAQKVFAAIS